MHSKSSGPKNQGQTISSKPDIPTVNKEETDVVYRVLRSGSWMNTADLLSVSEHGGWPPHFDAAYTRFRIAREA